MNAQEGLQTSGNSSLGAKTLIARIPDVLHPSPFLNSRHGAAIFDDIEGQMLAFQLEHDATVQELRKYYVFIDDASVTGFLNGHRTIPQILLEATSFLRASFDSDTIFNLQVSTDESEPGPLYAVAIWMGTVQRARQSLTKFDDTWWVANSGRASGFLNFTYELA